MARKEKDMENYKVETHGAIVAIKIFLNYEHGCTPMAELVTARGEATVIDWSDVDARAPFLAGITSYTLVYDVRPKRKFDEWNASTSNNTTKTMALFEAIQRCEADAQIVADALNAIAVRKHLEAEWSANDILGRSFSFVASTFNRICNNFVCDTCPLAPHYCHNVQLTAHKAHNLFELLNMEVTR